VLYCTQCGDSSERKCTHCAYLPVPFIPDCLSRLAVSALPPPHLHDHHPRLVPLLPLPPPLYALLTSTDVFMITVPFSLLQESVPTRAYVDQYAYAYFLFSFYEMHADVVISVTPFTGDPDIYVTACSLGQAGVNANCTTRPSNTSYDDAWCLEFLGPFRWRSPRLSVRPCCALPSASLWCRR
jgi:hypothetical protein